MLLVSLVQSGPSILVFLFVGSIPIEALPHPSYVHIHAFLTEVLNVMEAMLRSDQVIIPLNDVSGI